MSGSSDPGQAADADLLRRAAEGDKEAFGVIFERYQHVVYRFARAMTGSAAAAEDVTQEVFVILIRDLKRYEPERASLSTYLYGIARNISRDRLRREGRLVSFLSSMAIMSVETSSVDPLERMVTIETGVEVRRALSRIPVKYREVIVLCDLHDLAYSEVSTVLHTSIGAVRSRLHRARRLLREHLSRGEKTGVRGAGSWVRYSV